MSDVITMVPGSIARRNKTIKILAEISQDDDDCDILT
jgi:hypothetical protein